MTGNNVGRVAGKVAFITGAARGQGHEHAVRLAEEGADILAVDVCEDIDAAKYPGPTEADLADTATLVEKSGRRILTAKADVRDLEGLRAAVQHGVAELGPLDIVVANAGISATPAPAAMIEQSAWQTVLDINLTGVWHTVTAALPHMTNGGWVHHPGQFDDGASRRRLPATSRTMPRQSMRPSASCTRWPMSLPRNGFGSTLSIRETS